MRTSSTATSGVRRRISGSALRPSADWPTSSRSGRSLIARHRPSRYIGWSSATNTRTRLMPPYNCSTQGEQAPADVVACQVLAEQQRDARRLGGMLELLGGAAGEQDDRGPAELAEAARHLEPVELGHAHVQERDVRRGLADDLQRLGAVGRLADEIERAEAPDGSGEPPAVGLVVVGDHDAHGVASG